MSSKEYASKVLLKCRSKLLRNKSELGGGQHHIGSNNITLELLKCAKAWPGPKIYVQSPCCICKVILMLATQSLKSELKTQLHIGTSFTAASKS